MQDGRFLNFCSLARYLVFDEAHYILDDSLYNKGISFFTQAFLGNSFPNATKIFMSGTMEEIYEYIQRVNRFPKEPTEIIEEKELLDKKREDLFSRNLTEIMCSHQNFNSVLSLPTDYSYIQPYKYKNIKDICSQISQTSIDEKWLIFVTSIDEGAGLKSIFRAYAVM